MNRPNDNIDVDMFTDITSAEATQLQTCQDALRKAEGRYAYLSADFDNYRKRAERERVRLAHEATKHIMLGVVGLVDNFERARALLPVVSTDTVGLPVALTQVQAGIELMYKSMLKFLEEHKVQPIMQAEHFDPTIHEALVSVSRDELPVELQSLPDDSVVEVLEKGYTLNGELLRPARVKIVRS